MAPVTQPNRAAIAESAVRTPRPAHERPATHWAAIRGVFADLDDALIPDGMLTGEVIAALQHLRSAGLCVVLLTSRSAGWCDQIARLWPVDAVVGEHGAQCGRYRRP